MVTNAGSGPASGWAGNYVAIKYSDGTSTLMAHMSTVSVSVGQTVKACQLVGAIGMTGRTFGPHVHFEVYPAGVTPGDVYKAVNPVAWLSAHGLAPVNGQRAVTAWTPNLPVHLHRSTGANFRASRLRPAEPKSTSAIDLSPSPEVATTLPIPNVACSTRSPAASSGIFRATGFVAP